MAYIYVGFSRGWIVAEEKWKTREALEAKLAEIGEIKPIFKHYRQGMELSTMSLGN